MESSSSDEEKMDRSSSEEYSSEEEEEDNDFEPHKVRRHGRERHGRERRQGEPSTTAMVKENKLNQLTETPTSTASFKDHDSLAVALANLKSEPISVSEAKTSAVATPIVESNVVRHDGWNIENYRVYFHSSVKESVDSFKLRFSTETFENHLHSTHHRRNGLSPTDVTKLDLSHVWLAHINLVSYTNGIGALALKGSKERLNTIVRVDKNTDRIMAFIPANSSSQPSTIYDARDLLSDPRLREVEKLEAVKQELTTAYEENGLWVFHKDSSVARYAKTSNIPFKEELHEELFLEGSVASDLRASVERELDSYGFANLNDLSLTLEKMDGERIVGLSDYQQDTTLVLELGVVFFRSHKETRKSTRKRVGGGNV
jgi:hypothetical protein